MQFLSDDKSDECCMSRSLHCNLKLSNEAIGSFIIYQNYFYNLFHYRIYCCFVREFISIDTLQLR